MNGNIASLKVSPRPRRVLQRPLVVLVSVEGGVVVSPAIVACSHALGGIDPSASQVVQVERQ